MFFASGRHSEFRPLVVGRRKELQRRRKAQKLSVMFSWNSQRRPVPTTYPANRGSTVVAQTVQGSIRAPVHSRAQHLQSFLNDPTLKRSTRKVQGPVGKTQYRNYGDVGCPTYHDLYVRLLMPCSFQMIHMIQCFRQPKEMRWFFGYICRLRRQR